MNTRSYDVREMAKQRLTPSLQRLLLLTVSACVVLSLTGMSRSSMLSWRRERVIVVGAGASGLAAAVALAGQADVLVLEAQQERLGGRVHTNHTLGVPLELGAVWIHRAEGNVVSALANKYGCKTLPSENKRLVIYDGHGARVPSSMTAEVYRERMARIMPSVLKRRASLAESGRDDVSLGTLMSRLPTVAAIGSELRRCVLDFLLFRDIVQDHTADLWQTSSATYDTDHYGGTGKDEILPGGYDCIIHGLAQELLDSPQRSGHGHGGKSLDGTREIRTGRAGEVTRLHWGVDGVLATLADGRVERADRAIVTVPLGVLKASVSTDSVHAESARGAEQGGELSTCQSKRPCCTMRAPVPPRSLSPCQRPRHTSPVSCCATICPTRSTHLRHHLPVPFSPAT